jgi:hypothetical protein
MMKKKRHILRTIVLTFLAVIVVVVGMFFMPKSVNVAYTEEDLQSYLDKGGILLDENSASIEDIFFGNYVSKGRRSVEGVITSAEATAILNKVADGNSILTKIRVKFVADGKYIASAQIGNDLSMVYEKFPIVNDYKGMIDTTLKGRSIYGEGTLIQGSDKPFEATFTNVSIGYIPFPVDQANDYGTYLGTEMNRIFESLPGFSMESFKIDEEGLHFKGTIPTEIQGIGS